MDKFLNLSTFKVKNLIKSVNEIEKHKSVYILPSIEYSTVSGFIKKINPDIALLYTGFLVLNIFDARKENIDINIPDAI